MITVLVCSKSKAEAEKYADESLKKFFSPDEVVEFICKEFVRGTEGIRLLNKNQYIALDRRHWNDGLEFCVDNLRRAAVMQGLLLEVIFVDLYRVVDLKDPWSR